jgi:molybdate transport system ATP-binding protein
LSLEAEVVARLGRLQLEVALPIEDGETVVLVGPNGAGKTTLLRALAGLVRLDAGRIVLDGEVLEDPESGIRVPPDRRRVGFVFQDYLLFPHLSVLENVAFGLRARGRDRAAARRRAREWLERMGLDELASARPRTLSGGQAQRIALARALATEPALLLLDEPLAALDAGARAEVRRGLRRYLASFPGARLVVSHDPLEAMLLADRVVVVEAGRVVQQGSIQQLGSQPRSAYVANLVGLNLFRGRGDGHRVRLAPTGELVVAEDCHGDVFAAVHPRAVALYRSRPEGSPRNVWAGRIEALDFEGDRVRVSVAGPVAVVAEVTAPTVAEMRLVEGDQVWASIKASEITVYPV